MIVTSKAQTAGELQRELVEALRFQAAQARAQAQRAVNRRLQREYRIRAEVLQGASLFIAEIRLPGSDAK